MKTKLRNQKGFTIIEVLIVLAIAGLILLIVFLAVPALQRNSRNTAIKNDVASVLGGISEYQGANSGSMPGSIGGTGTVTLTCSGNNCTSNPTTAKVQGSTVVSSGTTALTTNPAAGNVAVVIGYKCGAGLTLGTASARAVSAYYVIETAGNTVLQCQES